VRRHCDLFLVLDSSLVLRLMALVVGLILLLITVFTRFVLCLILISGMFYKSLPVQSPDTLDGLMVTLAWSNSCGYSWGLGRANNPATPSHL
jgi:hypothetical protein